jgi:CubicO group peptidase (beta-lactamase class C family)
VRAFEQLRRWPRAVDPGGSGGGDGNAAVAPAAVVVDRRGVIAADGPTERPFPLASVTKPLVALAILVAAEEGTLSLDDPAGPRGSTVRHLLAHASGLAPDGDAVLAPPAQRRIYSNSGFEALGRVLQQASGLDGATYLHEAVVEPLGLVATALPATASPAHGAHASAGDLGRVARELLEPTLLDPATLSVATTPAFPELAGVLPGFGPQDPNPWGLGFEIRGHKSPHWTAPTSSARTFGHFGRAGTFCWVDPVAGFGCVVLSAVAFGPWAVEAWPAFNDAVVAELG